MKNMKAALTFLDENDKPIAQTVIGNAWTVPEQAEEMLKNDKKVLEEVVKTISNNIQIHSYLTVEKLLKKMFRIPENNDDQSSPPE